MSDNDVSIPPLRTGVVFAEWAPVVRDKLKAAKHGIIFRMPDPRKRSRFTGSSQCAQENHPLRSLRASASRRDLGAMEVVGAWC